MSTGKRRLSQQEIYPGKSASRRRRRWRLSFVTGVLWQSLPRNPVELLILIGVVGFIVTAFRMALPVHREARAIRRAEHLESHFSVEEMWPKWANDLLTRFKLPVPKRLTRLSLSKKVDVDWVVESLAGCGGLTKLELDESDVSDDALRFISGLSTLESLYLSETRISDDGVRQLSRLKALRHLTLSGTATGDDGTIAIAELRNLELLHLDGTKITDVGLSRLKTLTRVEWLNLQGTMIGDVGISEIGGYLPSFQLDVTDTNISSESVEALSRMKPLRVLRLTSTQLDRADFEKLRWALPGTAIQQFGPGCLEYHKRWRSRLALTERDPESPPSVEASRAPGEF